jgi:hypothetical protein
MVETVLSQLAKPTPPELLPLFTGNESRAVQPPPAAGAVNELTQGPPPSATPTPESLFIRN